MGSLSIALQSLYLVTVRGVTSIGVNARRSTRMMLDSMEEEEDRKLGGKKGLIKDNSIDFLRSYGTT
ncbi:hypothetical protein L804_06130 [Cryptococcus deuterogattii 2001/935-1]|nr:hypothetical protein L804_06130 [Cryptococcus deuterogattii 2001/935-1]